MCKQIVKAQHTPRLWYTRIRTYAYAIALLTAFHSGQIYKAHSMERYTGLPVFAETPREMAMIGSADAADIVKHFYSVED